MKMQFRKVKTLRGYAPLARFLAECEEEPVGSVSRQDLPETPRYSFSPEYAIEQHAKIGRFVRIETAHRKYEIWQLIGAPQ